MLQSSGKINTKDIALELGEPEGRMGLRVIYTGGEKYVHINGTWKKLCKCSYQQPPATPPFKLRSWYGYDHDAEGVTGVDIVGKTAVLPGEIVPYEALINGPNQIGITLVWETYNGSTWSVAGYGASINITWGANPAGQKLRLTVQGQCQGGESALTIDISQKITYYNMISCGVDLGVVRHTTTPMSLPGQRVYFDDDTLGVHWWDGTVTDIAFNYAGPAHLYAGYSYCDDIVIPTYYVIKRCTDDALFCTTTKIGRKNQRVKDENDVTYTYVGDTFKSAVYTNIGSVTIIPGKIRCSDPIGDPVFYELSSCSGGPIAYTSTPLSIINTRVSAGINGIYTFTGGTTNSPSNDIGEVNIIGAYGCGDGGSPGGGIYSELYRCSNGALYYTLKTFATIGQKVSTSLGEMYYTGNTTNSPGTLISEGDITELANQTGCASSGGTTYYQLRRCGTQDIYYTPTNPGTAGQRVSSLSAGYLVYTGVTTSSPPNNIGTVFLVSGQWGCDDEGAGTEYKSTYRKDYFRKNNCTSGQGSLVEVTANEGQFVSTENVQHANDIRDAWMQNQANISGTCTGGCPSLPAPVVNVSAPTSYSGYVRYDINITNVPAGKNVVVLFRILVGSMSGFYNNSPNYSSIIAEVHEEEIVKIDFYFPGASPCPAGPLTTITLAW